MGAGVLACPDIIPGSLVGSMYGAMVPEICPVAGVNVHLGC